MLVDIIIDWVISLSHTGVTVIANMMIQSSIIICIGFFTAFLLRSQGAAVQSLIYRAVLGAVILCVPVTMLIEQSGYDSLKVVVPIETIEKSASMVPGASGLTVREYSSKTNPFLGSTLVSSQVSAAQPAASVTKTGEFGIADFNPFGNSPISHYIRTWLYVLVTMVWIALSVFAVLRLIGYVISVQWLRKTAIDADKSVINSVWRISNELNVDPPDVMLSPFARSPFLTGLFSPTILLPEGITITDAILYHELAHHRRHDCFWNIVSEIACALMPLQPLMTVLSRAIEETSDYVSDHYALAFGDEAHAYAVQLASIAAQFQPVPAEAAVGVGFISAKSSLIKRIEHILDESGRFLISVKANVVVAVVIFAFGTAVLTGFVGFKKEILSEQINIIDIRIVETVESVPEEELADNIVSPVAESDIKIVSTAGIRQEQITGEITEQDLHSLSESVSERAKTNDPETGESGSDEAGHSDWMAFSESYEQENIETVGEETSVVAVNEQDPSVVSSTLIDETPVRLFDETENRTGTNVIYQKAEPQKSEYDQIERDPEIPRSAKSGNPLAELKSNSASFRQEVKKSADTFSWEILLSDKQRR